MKSQQRVQPGNVAIRFLSWFCPEHLYEEIEGDLIQKFNRDVKSFGERKARRRLIWNTIRFFRPGILFRNRFSAMSGKTAIILNYFNITFRTIRRNRLYSVLNITGLAIGIAAFLFIVQYATYEKSYDKFHENYKDLYRIRYAYTYFKNGITTTSAASPPRVSPFMKEMMPEVKSFARVMPFSGMTMSYGIVKLRQDRVFLVDPDFLEIFSFPLIEGDPKSALKEIRTVVISERMAKIYFGDQTALGKIIGVDGIEKYRITGVAKDAPENSHLKFDFLISYETAKWWTDGEADTSWWIHDYYQYILLQPGTDAFSFDQRFAKVFERERGKVNADEKINQVFSLQPITDIHLFSKLDSELNPEEQGDGHAINFLMAIAFFILLIAWINYINLFTARATERAKEVGIRKTIGAFRSQLIGQFMIESLVMNCLAVILALAIVLTGLSYFNLLTNSLLTSDFLAEVTFWQKLIVFLIVGSFISGLYPSLVLSSYRPITVLKGKLMASRSGIVMRRTLVIFQFAASVALIASTIIIYRQLDYMRNSELGFDMAEVMVVRGPSVRDDELTPAYKKRNSTFVQRLLGFSGIRSVTGGSTVPGEEIPDRAVIKRYEDPASMFKFVQAAWVGYDYFSTLGVKMLAGRSFSREITGDTLSVILNESAVKSLGFSSAEEAINQKVSVGVQKISTIIGVVNDFNQMSLHGKVKPIFFDLYDGYSSYYVVRFEKGEHQEIIERIKGEYEKFYPREPYDYFFLDEFFNRQYHREQKFSRVFTMFAGLAILVSCLGLFGLSSFTTLQRTKEIGIRKVLGADSVNIAYLLSKEYILLVAAANILAWPMIHFSMEDWLSNFANRIPIDPAVFFVSGFLVVFIAIATVSYKTIVTAKTDPVKTLRYE